MNPYKILNLDRNITKSDIIQSAAIAMKQRIYSGKEIAIAQQRLMDPISKGAEEFICFIDVSPILELIKENLNLYSEQLSEINDELIYISRM